MNSRINEVTSSEELDRLFDSSQTAPVLLFKHSVTCPISTNVFGDVRTIGVEINVVVVQNSRSVSNEIADRLGIRHESPQAIVVSGGRAVYHASHYDVAGEDIVRALNFGGQNN